MQRSNRFVCLDWAVFDTRFQTTSCASECDTVFRDTSVKARENLQRILNVKFPSKSDATLDENMAIECGICYSFLLEKVCS